MEGNISLSDITETYKKTIANATQAMEDAKNAIDEKATPQQTMDFEKALENWKIMTSAAFRSLSGVSEAMTQGMNSR